MINSGNSAHKAFYLLFSFIALFVGLTTLITNVNAREFELTLNSSQKSQLRLRDFTSVPTYYTNEEFNFEGLSVGSCNVVFDQLIKFLNLRDNNFFQQSHLYCKQQILANGKEKAVLLKFASIIESFGDTSSNEALLNYIKGFKDYVFHSNSGQFNEVLSIVKNRVFSANHSFVELETLYSEEFKTEVKNVFEHINESNAFFAKLDTKNKESYENFIINRLQSKNVQEWLNLFENAKVDVLKLYTSSNTITVKTTDEEDLIKVFEDHKLFPEVREVDTRWDEGDVSDASKVCVTIDTYGTEQGNRPNKAFEVNDVSKSITLKDGKVSCFDLSKTYYMMHFLSENNKSVMYGTVCRYVPFSRHEGKTLHFIGEHGQYKCPVY